MDKINKESIGAINNGINSIKHNDLMFNSDQFEWNGTSGKYIGSLATGKLTQYIKIMSNKSRVCLTFKKHHNQRYISMYQNGAYVVSFICC